MKTITILAAALVLSGCAHPAQKAADAITAFQKAADEVGLEAYESAWNFGSTDYHIERDGNDRVATFEHKNTWKPRTYIRTRKPIVTPAD